MIVPFRYLVPRPGYFRMLRLARSCPEIAGNVNREAVLKLTGFLVALPYYFLWLLVFPLLVPAVAVVAVALVLTQVRPRPRWIADRVSRNSDAVTAVLSADGMRRRMEAFR